MRTMALAGLLALISLTAMREASARQIRSPDLAAGTIVNFLGAKIPGSYWLDLRG